MAKRDGYAYQEVLVLAQEAAKKENDEDSESNAFKLSILFGSLSEAQSYIDRRNQVHPANRPFHDACALFEIPESGLWDVETWRLFVKEHEYSPRSMALVRLAPQFDQMINGCFMPHRAASEIAKSRQIKVGAVYQWQFTEHMKTHPSFSGRFTTKNRDALTWEAICNWLPDDYRLFSKEFPKSKSVHLFFERVAMRRDFLKIPIKKLLDQYMRYACGEVEERYKSFYQEAIAAGFSGKELQLAIQILKRGKPVSLIPQVKVVGDAIGYPGYVFENLPSDDPMMFLLGSKTGCCQNLNGHSSACVVHGATNPNGGFVTLKKPSSKNPWVAQSWIAFTEEGDLIFDSIEYNLHHDPKMVLAFYHHAAQAILVADPKIKRVLFGGGGNSPQIHSFPLLEKGKNYSQIIGYEQDVGYDSKHQRYILASQG